MTHYATLGPLLDEMRNLILQDYDNINLITGREGKGKSLWMRKVARKLDPLLDCSHIHFTQDDFFNDVASLERGRAVILDEFRGHKRLAMTGDRMEFLDFTKEARGLGLHIFIGFNRVSSFEKDLLSDRISYWHHLPKRGVVEIRKPETSLIFDMEGRPLEPTKYPHIATFPFTTKNDPLRSTYLKKKEERMRDRASRFTENHADARPPPSPFPSELLDKYLPR